MNEFVSGRIRFVEHPVRFAGGTLNTRMTLITLSDGGLLLHSPVPIDDELRAAIEQLGEVRAIVAASNCHHLFIADAQRAFPNVPTYAVAGLAQKRKDLVLAPFPEDAFSEDLERVVVGNRVMREMVFLDRASHTVIAVDLVEHFRDGTSGTDVMRFWINSLGCGTSRAPLRSFACSRAIGAQRARRSSESFRGISIACSLRTANHSNAVPRRRSAKRGPSYCADARPTR